MWVQSGCSWGIPSHQHRMTGESLPAESSLVALLHILFIFFFKLLTLPFLTHHRCSVTFILTLNYDYNPTELGLENSFRIILFAILCKMKSTRWSAIPFLPCLTAAWLVLKFFGLIFTPWNLSFSWHTISREKTQPFSPNSVSRFFGLAKWCRYF